MGAPKKNNKTKYIDRITQSSEEAVLEENLFKVEQNELQLKHDLLAARKEVAGAKKHLESLLRAGSLDSGAILNQQDVITSKIGDVTALGVLIKELF